MAGDSVYHIHYFSKENNRNDLTNEQISEQLKFLVCQLSEHISREPKFWDFEIKKGFVYLPPLDPIRQNEYFCSVHPDDEPIDVVYTWVNGSDPQFMESIQSLKTKKETSSRRFYGKEGFYSFEL